jgi:hypothetical protein
MVSGFQPILRRRFVSAVMGTPKARCGGDFLRAYYRLFTVSLLYGQVISRHPRRPLSGIYFPLRKAWIPVQKPEALRE